MRLVFILPVFVFLGMGIVQAQTIINEEARHGASKDEQGYQFRRKDERYEGMYTAKATAPALNIVSFIYSPIKYALGNNDHISVTVPAISRIKALNVTGVNFGMPSFYRLDMEVKPGRKKTVPVDAVLSHNNIFYDHLGLYGFYGHSEDPDWYAPLILSENGVTSKILLTVVPNTFIQRIWCNYSINDNGECKTAKLDLIPVGKGLNIKKGEAITFELDTAKFKPGQLYCVNFFASVDNNLQPVTRLIRILIPPVQNAKTL